MTSIDFIVLKIENKIRYPKEPERDFFNVRTPGFIPKVLAWGVG